MSSLASPVSPSTAGPARRRRVWTVLGVVFGTISVLWAGLALASLLAHGTSSDSVGFRAADVHGLTIDVDRGNVVVVPAAPGADIVVDTARVEGLFSPHSRAVIVDGQLRLSSQCSALAQFWCSVHYRVEIPASIPVTVVTDTGRIAVRGLAGPLTLHSDAGDITAEDLTSPSLTATGNLSDIRLSFLAPVDSVSADTDIGDVEVIVPDDASSYSVSITGDIGHREAVVRTDPASARRIVARADVGDVTVRYP